MSADFPLQDGDPVPPVDPTDVVLPIASNIDSLYPGEALVEVKGKPGRPLGDQIRP